MRCSFRGGWLARWRGRRSWSGRLDNLCPLGQGSPMIQHLGKRAILLHFGNLDRADFIKFSSNKQTIGSDRLLDDRVHPHAGSCSSDTTEIKDDLITVNHNDLTLQRIIAHQVVKNMAS